MRSKNRSSTLLMSTFAIALIVSGLAASASDQFVHPVGPFSPPFAPLATESGSQVLYQPHDGSFEAGFSFDTDEESEFVQFWAFPSPQGILYAFEACFFSYVPVPDFQFKFGYYSGAEGQQNPPDDFEEDRDSSVFDIPAGTPTCSSIYFLGQGGPTDPGVEIWELFTYLGLKWNGEDYPTVLLLVDTNGPSTTAGWGQNNEVGSDWLKLEHTPAFSDYKNLGIRFLWSGPTYGQDPIFEDDFESGDTSAWSATSP